MKKNLFYFILFKISFVLLFSSCENELSYHEKDKMPKLTMNAFIYIDSLENLLHLSYTGVHEAIKVEEATVEVRVNGDLKETLYPLAEDTEVISTKYLSFFDKQPLPTWRYSPH
ncbi:MAG: DUF4249 domain-containing protein [Bacteroides sp.]|nr:DUF4249 domain-containing protein [Bacteroides sp.]